MFAAASTSASPAQPSEEADAHSRDPFHDYASRFVAGRIGMALLLLSLGTLFAASIVGFVVIRIQLADVWPTGKVTLPRALWISTAVLLASSGTMHAASRAIGRGMKIRTAAALLVTFLLGVAFLALQVHCWLVALAQLRSTTLWLDSDTFRLAVTSFYIFSGVHGLHVIGGLVPMSLVIVRAAGGRYDEAHHAGVTYSAMYWHFLDGVWIVLFTTLLLAT